MMFTKNNCKVINPNNYKDVTWSGECIDGIAKGKGTLTWTKKGKTQGIFIGTLLNGVFDGEGEFMRINKHGINDEKIKGNFKNGLLEGLGEVSFYYYDIGGLYFSYKGVFKNGKITGKPICKTIQEDGYDLYEGEINIYLKYHGEGKLTKFRNGKIIEEYFGTFENNLKSGYGEEILGKNKYKGNWVKGNKVGYGELFFQDTLLYKGDWNKEPEGIGKMFYLNGSIYFGEFKNGLRHGFGIHRWSNGCIYIGEFLKGLLHASGYIENKGKIEKAGYWKYGQLFQKGDSTRVKNAALLLHEKEIKDFKSFMGDN